MAEIILKAARGSFQRDFASALASGATVRNPVSGLRGRAASYSGRYSASLRNYLDRLAAQGVKVEIRRGPGGGWWSATFRVVQ